MTESEILLTAILDCPRSSLYTQALSLNAGSLKRFNECLSLRAQGVPLQYILGETEFFGMKFKVHSGVFIPRPETEILVETVIKRVTGNGIRDTLKILDIGTGSGCIAVSLAKFCLNTHITAIDISKDALEVARENARVNGVEQGIEFLESDLFTCYLPVRQAGGDTCYDIIVSNPPYIATDDVKGLQREIHYEPRIALDGGGDGLDFYRRIIAEAPQFLKRDGLLMMEMGYGQSKPIKNIFEKIGNFEIIEIAKDYSSIERVIIARVLTK